MGKNKETKEVKATVESVVAVSETVKAEEVVEKVEEVKETNAVEAKVVETKAEAVVEKAEPKKAAKKTTVKKTTKAKKAATVNVTLQVAGKSFDVDEFMKKFVEEHKDAADVHFYFNMDERKVYPVVDGVAFEGTSLF